MPKAIIASVAFLVLMPRIANAADLSTAAALDAATTSLASCEQSGYRVTVTVVDKAGLPIAIVKGDGAAPHTLDSSRGKAYTAMTLGALFGETTTSRIADKVRSNAAAAALEDVPGILLLGGGVSLQLGGEVVGGLGVGGAPGGLLDEACAIAGAETVGRAKRRNYLS